MAIMWEPPAERLSLEATPAELAWRGWLMQALVAKEQNATETALEASQPGSREAWAQPSLVPQPR